MTLTPLERLFPNRCYDCLAPIPNDALLCAHCEALYAAEEARLRAARVKRESRVE